MMKKNYFSTDEDFEKIINKTLEDKQVIEIKPITTGWTNIVFEVTTDKGAYFFRFPRDDFWTRTIVKDYEFSKYIDGKTSFHTVQLQLGYDNDRPFSIHKKIEGTPLAEKMNDLSPEEIKDISADIAKFMFQLHHVKYEGDSIFKINNIGLDLVDFLDELLEVHVDRNDKIFWHYDICKQKEKNCLVHGDLNSSNILLDDNNQVCAIIDLGFAGYGNKYFDISRIIGRCPANFKQEIINSYENLMQDSLDYNILDQEIDIWSKIDSAYINYMTKIGIYKK